MVNAHGEIARSQQMYNMCVSSLWYCDIAFSSMLRSFTLKYLKKKNLWRNLLSLSVSLWFYDFVLGHPGCVWLLVVHAWKPSDFKAPFLALSF